MSEIFENLKFEVFTQNSMIKRLGSFFIYSQKICLIVCCCSRLVRDSPCSERHRWHIIVNSYLGLCYVEPEVFAFAKVNTCWLKIVNLTKRGQINHTIKNIASLRNF